MKLIFSILISFAICFPMGGVSETMAGSGVPATAAPALEPKSPLKDFNIQKSNPPQCRFLKQFGWHSHAGCDMSGPGAGAGSAILATLPGKVVQSGPLGGYGNAVTIEHDFRGKKIYSKYAHMQHGCPRPAVGALVQSEQKIGCVGTTGRSLGNHLHFEIRGAANGGITYDSKHFITSKGELNESKLCAGKSGGAKPAKKGKKKGKKRRR
jgi:murein DD-endopeptidase MepM/ murein hydrolase activator NlpD